MVASCVASLLRAEIHGDLVVAVVDLHERGARAHAVVIRDGNGHDDAGDPRRDDRHIGPHIGVVGGDEIAAFRQPVSAVIAAETEDCDEARNERDAGFGGALRRFLGRARKIRRVSRFGKRRRRPGSRSRLAGRPRFVALNWTVFQLGERHVAFRNIVCIHFRHRLALDVPAVRGHL